MHPMSFDLTGRLFFWSNALYVLGALLTFASAVWIVYGRRTRAASSDFTLPPLRDSIIVAPAAVCLLGTIAAICFSGMLLNQQRASLETFKLQTALELSRLRHATDVDTLAAERSQTSDLGAPSEAPAFPGSLDKTVAFDFGAAARPHSHADLKAETAGDLRADLKTDPKGSLEVDPSRQLAIDPAAAEPLRSFEGLRAVVESSPSDAEASQFADHLMLLLIASGVDARQGRDQTVLQQLISEPGVHLRYLDPDRGHDFAATLARLLRNQGLHVDVAPSLDLAVRAGKSASAPVTRDQLLISVGPK